MLSKISLKASRKPLLMWFSFIY